MDLTGMFPHFSANGHEYLLVEYNYGANEILVEPLKNLQANTIADGWQNINRQFASAGVQPHTHFLDNEDPTHLINHSKKRQLPTGTTTFKSRNIAERVIQTFNDHLKAGLATLDPDFPFVHWNLLLTQAVMNLNILQSS